MHFFYTAKVLLACQESWNRNPVDCRTIPGLSDATPPSRRRLHQHDSWLIIEPFLSRGAEGGLNFNEWIETLHAHKVGEVYLSANNPIKLFCHGESFEHPILSKITIEARDVISIANYLLKEEAERRALNSGGTAVVHRAILTTDCKKLRFQAAVVGSAEGVPQSIIIKPILDLT